MAAQGALTHVPEYCGVSSTVGLVAFLAQLYRDILAFYRACRSGMDVSGLVRWICTAMAIRLILPVVGATPVAAWPFGSEHRHACPVADPEDRNGF